MIAQRNRRRTATNRVDCRMCDRWQQGLSLVVGLLATRNGAGRGEHSPLQASSALLILLSLLWPMWGAQAGLSYLRRHSCRCEPVMSTMHQSN